MLCEQVDLALENCAVLSGPGMKVVKLRRNALLFAYTGCWNSEGTNGLLADVRLACSISHIE